MSNSAVGRGFGLACGVFLAIAVVSGAVTVFAIGGCFVAYQGGSSAVEEVQKGVEQSRADAERIRAERETEAARQSQETQPDTVPDAAQPDPALLPAEGAP